MCNRLERALSWQRSRKERTRAWHRGKGADAWTGGRRDDGGKKGGKKGGKGSKPDRYDDKDKRGIREKKAKARATA